jgi:iron complex transport system substrate-binding protein
MNTKILVLIGIAMCAILLTSPALASAGYSKIYGNANEDDVLDMRDVTYIKLVIFGKKPATTFADANYDGKISMLDIGQTKLIILGKEKKLTLIDMADRIVTVPRPLERIVSTFPEETRVIVEVGGVDKLVGVSSYLIMDNYAPNFIMLTAYPQLKELPGVGSYREPNLEQIVRTR